MAKKTISECKWCLEETKTANFGDERLNRRFGNTLEMLGRKPGASIPAVAKGWDETKAAYRFFDNEEVTFEKVLTPHGDVTEERIGNESTVLLLQDTTELDYSSKKQTRGLGKLNYENQLGVHLHVTLAVTPRRKALGIISAEILVRERLGGNQRAKLPIEEKESRRWLNSYREAQRLAERYPDKKIVSIADREGDIYDIFVEAQEAKESNRAEWIIRGNQNRHLLEVEDGKRKRHKKLMNKIRELPIVETIEFTLPKLKNREMRKIRQEIMASTLQLKAPRRRGQKLPDVSINVIYAKEVDAPFGVKPIEWVLLTSLPVGTKEEVLQVIEWYLCRWQIEIYFKILKVGCRVEELQLQTLDRLKPCLALYMIIAWRILYIMMLGRDCPELPCNAVFEDEEWHAAYIVTHRRPPPQKPPSLDRMIKMIAGLGGFLNRRGDNYPGPKTIWLGLQRTKDFVIAMKAQNASRHS